MLSVERRTGFGVNWSTLSMASSTALLVIHAPFAKSAKKAK
jgi:hypothetical protein